MQMTCREFNQQISQAQRAAQVAPVFISNRGRPAFVLISQAEYDRLTAQRKTALEALTPPPELAAKLEKIDFEIEPRSTSHRPVIDLGL